MAAASPHSGEGACPGGFQERPPLTCVLWVNAEAERELRTQVDGHRAPVDRGLGWSMCLLSLLLFLSLGTSDAP